MVAIRLDPGAPFRWLRREVVGKSPFCRCSRHSARTRHPPSPNEFFKDSPDSVRFGWATDSTVKCLVARRHQCSGVLILSDYIGLPVEPCPTKCDGSWGSLSPLSRTLQVE